MGEEDTVLWQQTDRRRHQTSYILTTTTARANKSARRHIANNARCLFLPKQRHGRVPSSISSSGKSQPTQRENACTAAEMAPQPALRRSARLAAIAARGSRVQAVDHAVVVAPSLPLVRRTSHSIKLDAISKPKRHRSTPKGRRPGRQRKQRRGPDPRWRDLPDELLWHILGGHLDPRYRAVAACVSWRWCNAVDAWAHSRHMPKGAAGHPRTLCVSTMRDAIAMTKPAMAVWLRDVCGCPMGVWAYQAIPRYTTAALHAAWVRWLRAAPTPCPWNEHVLLRAAHNYDLDLVAWLRAQDPPCPWSARACATAAIRDAEHFNSIGRFVRRRGTKHTNAWQRREKKRLAQYMPPVPMAAGVCTVAVTHQVGVPTMLAWLRAQDPPCPWDGTVLSAALEYGWCAGDFIVRWARAQSSPCPWDTYAVANAARHHGEDFLAWALDDGAPLAPEVAIGAARRAIETGNMASLQLLLDRYGDSSTKVGTTLWTPAVYYPYVYRAREAGAALQAYAWLRNVARCPWNKDTCVRLAGAGFTDALRWARTCDPPCPWDALEVCGYAAIAQRVEVLRWMRTEGGLSADVFMRAMCRSATWCKCNVLDVYFDAWPEAVDLDRLCASARSSNFAKVSRWVKSVHSAHNTANYVASAITRV